MIYDCIIIGGGSSGLFCASLFENKIRGLIIEHTGKLGTKLLMSGGGQCNITHGGSIKDFVQHYGSKGKSIRGLLYKNSNEKLIKFLSSIGVDTFEREDEKVFPSSLKARTIRDALLSKAKDSGFEILVERRPEGLKATPDGKIEVILGDEKFITKNLVIAVGGKSYPTSGSDGSFFPIIERDLGITINPLAPALATVSVADYPYSQLSGISFPNATMEIQRAGQKLHRASGDLLITHRDFSGPLVINNSRYISQGHKLTFNYIGLNFDTALERLKKAAEKNKSHLYKIASREFNIPVRFSEELFKRLERPNSLREAVSLLTGDEFVVTGLSGFKTAMVTKGGIALDEINLKTMELNKFNNVFAIGECVDIDGDTGGYNLQFAFSSAKAAVDEISKRISQ